MRRASKVLITCLLATASGLLLAIEVGPPTVVSRTYAGFVAIGPCGTPHFARMNSRYLSFGCRGVLTKNDDNDHADTFWFDRNAAQLERVSLTSAGQEIRFDSLDGFPSSDGRYVSVESLGPLHPDAEPISPGFERRNAFLRDRSSGTTDFVSRNSDGEMSLFGVGLQDSLPDRQEVLLQTRSRLLNPPDDPFANDTNLYVRNWQTHVIELVSANPDGTLADGVSGGSRLSTNGRYVLFASTATTLPGAPVFGSGINLYLRDRETQTTERLTRPWHGGEFTGEMTLDIHTPRISANGRWVLFGSSSLELLPNDAGPPTTQQVYLLDRQTGQFERISADEEGLPGDAFSGVPDMSDDGRYLTFFSRASNLPAGHEAIYVIDRETGEWANATAALGPQSGSSPNLELARDGSAIAFSWRVTDPSLPDLVGRNPIYTVALLGDDPAPAPTPVPGLRFAWIIALVTLVTWVAAFSGIGQRSKR
jgi:hypothetical protein